MSKNNRDLFISYVIVFLIFAYIGIIGYLGVFGQKAKSPNTLFDYLQPDEFLTLIIQVLFAFFLSCT